MMSFGLFSPADAVRRLTLARDLLHDRLGALADERDRHRVGPHAVASDAAGCVVSLEEHANYVTGGDVLWPASLSSSCRVPRTVTLKEMTNESSLPIFERFAAWLFAEPTTPKRDALRAVVEALIFAWGYFLAITYFWWLYFSSRRYPFKWIVLVSIFLGVFLAHGLWRFRRSARRRSS